jgi:hypothetical protein
MAGRVAHGSKEACETSVNFWGQIAWLGPRLQAFSPCSLKGKPFERAGRKATDLPELSPTIAGLPSDF